VGEAPESPLEPYYRDELVTLYCGDCREITDWLAADVLITDPPYGIGYDRKRGTWKMPADRPRGISSDGDTALRDWALEAWGADRVAIAFGDLKLPRPARTAKTLIYRKPPDSGTHGALGGFRHDVEAIYLIGKWPAALGGRSSVIESGARMVGGSVGPAGRYGHPHAKPVDVMEQLIQACPPPKRYSRPVRRLWLHSRRCEEPRPLRYRSGTRGALLRAGRPSLVSDDPHGFFTPDPRCPSRNYRAAVA
jgi:site-specific DNA-methyltransferase (adenine-specific)